MQHPRAKLARVAVHPTCSMNHLGISSQLSEIASSLAVEAETPIGDTCCGTAGDRGLLHPELVVSGTRDTKAVLDAKPADVKCFVRDPHSTHDWVRELVSEAALTAQ